MTRRIVCDTLESAGIVVVAQARDGEEAVRLGIAERPDVVLMDVVMPGSDGIVATKRLVEAVPDVAVIILSVGEDDDLGMLALEVGAVGFLTKDIDVAVLPQVLEGVRNGEAAIKRTLTRTLIESLRSASPGKTGTRAVKSPLTGREWEIVDLLCAGCATDEIAESLTLSVETVRSHTKSVFRKLGAHSREQAVAAAERLRRPPAGRPKRW